VLSHGNNTERYLCMRNIIRDLKRLIIVANGQEIMQLMGIYYDLAPVKTEVIDEIREIVMSRPDVKQAYHIQKGLGKGDGEAVPCGVPEAHLSPTPLAPHALTHPDDPTPPTPPRPHPTPSLVFSLPSGRAGSCVGRGRGGFGGQDVPRPTPRKI
jgi:hypothetical protein